MPRHHTRFMALALPAMLALTTLIAALVLPAAPAQALPPKASPPQGEASSPPLWQYHEKGYDLYTPQLSPDNSRLVFTRKRHMPDGHEAEMYTRQELEEIDAPLRTDKRYAYDEMVVLRVRDLPLYESKLKRRR